MSAGALPPRRPATTRTVAHRGRDFTVTVGFDEAGRPREVFAAGAKEGSDIQALISEIGRVISVALQHGTPPAALSRPLGSVPARGPDGRDAAASLVGAIVAIVADEATS